MIPGAIPSAARQLPAGDPDDAACAVQTRSAIAHADARLGRRFDQGDDIDRLLGVRRRVIDHALIQAWQRCVPADSGLSLFAVGGYGRGELFPCSDIDVLVLGEPACQQAGHEALSRFFALLWDAGVPVSHAVRSPGECTQACADDQTVTTALIEARALAVAGAGRERLQDAIAPSRVWPPHAFFLAKREELQARHQRFDNTADNLEPNIKEGPGGLRDLHTLGWMALRTYGVRDLDALVGLGHLGHEEAAALRRERKLLSRLRYGLHLVAKRPEERLRFDYQKTLAERLGHADDGQSLGVEKMMQAFYRSAALILRLGDRLLQRFEEQFDGEARPEPVDAEFDLRRGYLAARDPHWPHHDIRRVFALFAAWAARPQVRGLHSRTARALAESLRRLPAYTDADAAARAAFIGLMRGQCAVDTLARMARLGVLAQWLPAFAQVSGRMQFDLFHVYTVDQHTLMVLRNIALFAAARCEERFSIAHEVWPRLRKPELLLLAGLFHDIGKGRGGDHSELGAADARAFCRAHGLSAGDTELVAWLVRQHLKMSTTAQKQDIADPDVICGFAKLAETRERLDFLYLLTCADIAGTSPKMWNAWKDRLLADLYFATRRVLRDGGERSIDRDARLAEAREAVRRLLAEKGHDDEVIARQFAIMPDESFLRGRAEQVAWQAATLIDLKPGDTGVCVRPVGGEGDALEVFVHSPDRDGLFAAILATLDRNGYGVHQAYVLNGRKGTVFDTFEVVPADSFATGDAATLQAALTQTLARPLDQIRVSRRAAPRQLKYFRFPARIELRTRRNARSSVLALVCPDRPGLLAEVAQVLRDCRLRVHNARIATFGERAEDLFEITDEDNRPLADECCRQALLDALHACLEPERKQ